MGPLVAKFLCITAAVLFLCQTCRSDDVDLYVQQQMQQQHIPGLSIAVVRAGQVVKAQGYGVENLEQGTSATADTVYRIASLTKQFTASAIMLLVQDGRIGLDDKISRYLNPGPAAWSEITVRQLLTHTSGIKDYLNEMHGGTCNGTNEEELSAALGSLPLNFEPGTGHAYSNTNYLVLGLIVKKVSGQSYDEFLSKRVFEPLGMSHTRKSDAAGIVPHRAGGYILVDGSLRNAAALEPTVYGNADAGLISTVGDLARWDAALLDGKILSKTSQAAMFQPAQLLDGSTVQYGFGWVIGKSNGPPFVSHAGNVPGASAYIVRYLPQQLTVIVLANRSDAPASPIARHIAAMYEPKLLLAHIQSASTPDPAVTDKLKTVLEGIQSGHLSPDLFASTMWKSSTERDQTAAYLRGLFASYGVFRSVSFLSVSIAGDKRQYFYEANFGDDGLIVDFTLDADRKIASMGVGTE